MALEKKKLWNYEFAKERLRELGRTREWLGRECRLKPTSLSKLLSGGSRPGPQTIYLMSRALEVTEEALLVGASEEKAS